MRTYSTNVKKIITTLRSGGYTYSEIQKKIGLDIPKSSLNYICKNVEVSLEGKERIRRIIDNNRDSALLKANEVNRLAFELKLEGYRKDNASLSTFMMNREAKIIALAMLYLGEGAKWQKSRSPKLSSSNPKIIYIYMQLVQDCYNLPFEKFRARIQHRANQNSDELVAYWSTITGIPRVKFYKSYIDKRTIGKVTKKPNYKGVCTISSPGTHIQLELDQITGIIFKALGGISAAG